MVYKFQFPTLYALKIMIINLFYMTRKTIKFVQTIIKKSQKNTPSIPC